MKLLSDVKEFRGKWVKTDETTGKITSHLIFGEFMVKAWKFIGIKKCTGFFLTERSVVFIEKERICFVVNVSTSGDVLTIANSDGIMEEYVKCPNYVPISQGVYDTIGFIVSALLAVGIIASIYVLLFM